LRIGVLAFQGAVSEHLRAVDEACGRGTAIPVRKAGQVPLCQGLVLPGGESTTIGRLLESTGVGREIQEAARSGVPIMATCAGLVLLSREIEGNLRVRQLGLMDITVSRNAFGPQRESFEADLDVVGFDRPYRAVFIRAPAVTHCGSGVERLAQWGRWVVAAREGNLLGLSFHPELTADMRFHELFLEMMEEAK